MANDIQEGLDFANSIAAMSRKKRAYDALRMAYGDAAGDPEAQARLQQTDEQSQLFPLQKAALGIANTGAQQKQNFAAQEQPDVQAQLKAKTAQEQGAAAKTQAQAEADQLATRQKATLNGALYVQGAISRGEDPGTAFDRIAPILGFDPAMSAKVRDSIVKNPAGVKDFIEALQKQVAQSGRFQIVQGQDGKLYRATAGGVEPLQAGGADGTDPTQIVGYQAPQGAARIAQGAQRLTQQNEQAQPEFKGAQAEAKTFGEAKGKVAAEDLPLSQTGQVKAAQALDSTRQSFDVADKAIKQAIADTGWLSAGPLASLPDFLNPSAAALRSDLVTAQSKVVLDTISEMKNLSKTGATGFGQLSDREGQLIQARLGAVLQSTSPRRLKQSLAELQTQLEASRSRIERAYTADQKARGVAAKPGSVAKPELTDDELLKQYGGK